MNDDELNRLIAAARRAPPDTAGVEDGFETRLRHLSAAPEPVPGPWSGLAWRAVPLAAAAVLALAAWNLSDREAGPPHLPEAMLGAADVAMLVDHFTGD
ncbi:hypothetical protein HQ590_10000 [bacterium]|nr:hypothetical protein [bacterium]